MEFTVLAIFVFVFLSIIGFLAFAVVFGGIDAGSPFAILGGLSVALLCAYMIFSDHTSGMKVENVTEIQEITTYDINKKNFVLAKKGFSVPAPYEDDNGDTKYAPMTIDAYLLPVLGETSPVQMQGDTPVIRTVSSEFPPALVCKYKIVTEGNFWFKSTGQPIDDAVEWFIQIPSNAEIVTIN